MKFHGLRTIPLWGDYGKILMNGTAKRAELAETGPLLLERAGPFAPPMMFTIAVPTGYVVMVTQSFRERLEVANFGQLEFKPTVKKRIVRIPWETWDRKARLPAQVPDSGEPEEYILGQEHSREAADQMGEIWEFIAPAVPCKIQKRELFRPSGPTGPGYNRWYLTRPKGPHNGLFYPAGGGQVLFVDDAGRKWFEKEGDGWIDFDEVVVV